MAGNWTDGLLFVVEDVEGLAWNGLNAEGYKAADMEPRDGELSDT
jgi:hypothetical protein